MARLPVARAAEAGGTLRCAIAMDTGGTCGRNAEPSVGVCVQHHKRIRKGWSLERLGERFAVGSRPQPPIVVVDPAALDGEIEAYIDNFSLRMSTRDGYERSIARVARFLGKPVLDCTPGDMHRLLTELVAAGCSPSTIDNLLAAVEFAHRRASKPSPTKDVSVREAAAGARRSATGRGVRRQPITPSRALQLIGPPPDIAPHVQRRRVTALLAVGAPTATPEALARIHPKRDIELTTSRATVRVGEALVLLNAEPDAPFGLCPVRALRSWLEVLPSEATSLLGRGSVGGSVPTPSGWARTVRDDLALVRRRLGGDLGTDVWRVAAAADLAFVRWLLRRAVIAVGLGLGSRVSDWRALTGDRVSRRGEARILTLGATKTDRDGGVSLALVPARHRRELCPVAALDDWLRFAQPGQGLVFPALTSGGRRTDRPLGPSAVSRMLKNAAGAALRRDPGCGLDPARISSRGLRCGFVVTALNDTPDLRLIATTTLHKNVDNLGRYGAAGRGARPARKLLQKGS